MISEEILVDNIPHATEIIVWLIQHREYVDTINWNKF